MFDPEMSDDELVNAVIDHYASALHSSKPARTWLGAHWVSDEVAKRFSVGFADRSLGNELPRSCYSEGKRTRERLFSLGICRQSGHEFFRGCVTVPITSPDGRLATLYGTRISGSLPAHLDRDLWLSGAEGAIFNAFALDSPDGPLIAAATIPLALAAISAGFESVVAPGRPHGFAASDVEAISSSGRAVVLVSRGSRDDRTFSVLGDGRGKTATISAQPLASLAIRIEAAMAGLDGGVASPVNRSSATTSRTSLQSLSQSPSQTPKSPGGYWSENNAAAPCNGALASGSATASTDQETPPVPITEAGDVHIDTEARSWRIRGASRSKGYETLRVNLMASDTVTGRFFVDCLDLYSARQRQGFIQAAAVELSADSDEISSEVGRCLLAAEVAADRLQNQVSPPVPSMNDGQRDETISWLQNPNLTDAIVCDVAALGLVGEEDAALLLYLALTSRLTPKPLSVVVASSSAAGKSTLADTVASLIPPEETLSYSALTSQALYYVSTGSLSHKVLVVAEDEGAQRAVYAMKLLVSAGKLAIASTSKDADTGRLTTASYEVVGPVSLLMTTTRPQVDDELASRLIEIAVTESPEQTRAIHSAQRSAYSTSGLVSQRRADDIISRHHNAQRLLQSLPVVIPMVDELTFADATTRSRRDHDKYLSLIAASVLLHQFQREVKTIEVDGRAVTYIEAGQGDVDLADRLAKGVIVRDSSELPPATSSLLGRLSSWAGTAAFTRRQAREALSLGDTQLKVHLHRLVDLEYVIATRGAGTVSYRLAWSPERHRANKAAQMTNQSQHGEASTASEALSRRRRDIAGGADVGQSQRRRQGRSGGKPLLSGGGRPTVGGRSGGGRTPPNGSSAQVGGQKPSDTSATDQNSAYGDDEGDSYVEQSPYVGDGQVAS